MKNEVIVPSMGESISEATVGKILAPFGSFVKVDAEILELETDKVNQVLYAAQAGIVEWLVKTGDIVAVGQVIGKIDPQGIPNKNGVSEAPPSQNAPKKADAPAREEVKSPSSSGAALKGNIAHHTKETFVADLKQSDKKEMKFFQEAVHENKESGERETRLPLSRIRKVIGQKLVEAQQTMAMLTTFNEVDLTHVIEMREKYKESFIKKYGCKLGFMSFFVKAAVSALHAFPEINSYLDGDEIVHRNYYDIGVAVGTDRGVIVPVIRGCDHLDFAGIEQTIEKYAKQAREGKLLPHDLQGGGFTITNGGVYGSLLSTPILLPPQCAILGMHKIEKRPVVINDEIVIRSMMYLALSYDHRLIDGKEAVSFLVHIKNLLEDPDRFLLEV